MQDRIQIIRDIIGKYNRFAVTGHVNPDGDAVGACYGLGMALEKIGKSVNVILEHYAPKLDIIPGSRLLYAGMLDDLYFDVLICLDCADKQRIKDFIPLFNKARVTVCIDHHETNTGFAMYNYIDGDASSTSELVFRLLDGFIETDSDIAAAIYSGLVYDTGGFRFSAVGKDTLDIAGRLMAMGIPFTNLYNEILHMRSYNAAQLLAKVITESKLKMDGRLIYACVTADMLRGTGALASDLDGIVEFLLNIRKAEAAALLYEKPNGEVKISFRSRGIGVDKIALELGGGGHKSAAGCNIFGAITDVTERVINMLERELRTVC